MKMLFNAPKRKNKVAYTDRPTASLIYTKLNLVLSFQISNHLNAVSMFLSTFDMVAHALLRCCVVVGNQATRCNNFSTRMTFTLLVFVDFFLFLTP